jgi:hypothetical protein
MQEYSYSGGDGIGGFDQAGVMLHILLLVCGEEKLATNAVFISANPENMRLFRK